jgi:predicted nucleotidyltransferase
MNQLKLNSKQDLLVALSNNREIIKSYGVNSLGIFGSFSTGSYNDASDVDLLVNFLPEKKSFDNFMDLSFFLEDLLGRKVEIVTPQSLSKYIGPHILKELQNVSLES